MFFVFIIDSLILEIILERTKIFWIHNVLTVVSEFYENRFQLSADLNLKSLVCFDTILSETIQRGLYSLNSASDKEIESLPHILIF